MTYHTNGYNKGGKYHGKYQMIANPFPGMNPYLEKSLQWPGLHTALIYSLNTDLNKVLATDFVARIQQRIYPNSYFDYEVRESFIEIRTANRAEELIAVLEILSPANKESGRGREEYRRKQRHLLNADIHFLEIDLLRAGEYTIAPYEEETRRDLGHWGYIVCLHRASAGEDFEVWPVTVRDRLPRLRLPLTETAGEIVVDLQAVLNRAYEDGSYDRFTDYSIEAEPPLSEADRIWADHILRQQGLR